MSSENEFEEVKDCRLESDLLPWVTRKCGDVDLACKFLRMRRTRVQGRVIHMTAKVQELQQELARAKVALGQEVHHYKILDQLLALEDGRRQAVTVKVIPVRRRKKETLEPKKSVDQLLNEIDPQTRQKLLAQLLEQMKGGE